MYYQGRGGLFMLLKVSDLRDLEIININDGRRLGPIKDIELDLEKGAIQALVMPNYTVGRILGIFGRSDDLIVPWEKIKRIGVDVLLVDLPSQQQTDFLKT
jgi:YlmC/YmxH family sporulation protein